MGIYDLHLSDAQFWGLTLVEFNALMERLNLSIERENYRTGLVCALTANIHRDPKSKAFTPQDFMPGKAKPVRKQTPEDMLNIVKMLDAAYKAKDKKTNG